MLLAATELYDTGDDGHYDESEDKLPHVLYALK